MSVGRLYFFLENPMDGGAWWAVVHEVTKSWTRLSNFTFTFYFHASEKEMAAHSSVLAWRIPGMAELGELPSMGSHRVGHDWSDLAAAAAAAFSCLTLKGSASSPRWALHDAKLWAGLCSSQFHLTAWCIERSGPHGKTRINDSLRRKALGLTCIHGEPRILIFSFIVFIRFRKVWSL